MVAPEWGIVAVALLLALAIAALEWRRIKRSSPSTRTALWYAKRMVLAVALIVLLYFGVVFTVAAIRTANSDHTQEIAYQERLCSSFKINCYPNVPAAESAATLSQYERDYSAWEKDGSSQRPNYAPLTMLMPDRVKAEAFFNRQVQTSVNSGLSTGPLIGSNALSETALGLAALALLFLMSRAKRSPFRSRQQMAPAARAVEAEHQRLARALGKTTTWDAFEEYMTPFRRRGFIISAVAMAVTYPVTILVNSAFVEALGFLFGTMAVLMIKEQAYGGFWTFFEDQNNPARAALRAEAVAKGIKVKNFGVKWSAPSMNTKGEFGTAGFAHDDHLHTQGFAEPERPVMSDEQMAEIAASIGGEFIRKPNGDFEIREKGFTG